MEEIIEIYEDSGLQKKLEGFDLGEVEIGKGTIRKTFYIKNISGGILSNLKFTPKGDMKVVSFPIGLKPEGTGEVVFEVRIPLNIKKSISSEVEIEAKIIYPLKEEKS